MSKIVIQDYKSAFGELVLGVYDEKLCLLDWKYRKQRDRIDKRIQNYFLADYSVEPHPLIDQAITQLEEYALQKRSTFNLPLIFAGTDFQKQVWNTLLDVKYSETCSYSTLAVSLSRKRNNSETGIQEKDLGLSYGAKNVRAVAAANGANCLSIVVPCHRVIGADGSLTGYAGGLPVKRKLLELEGAIYPDKQTSLF